MMEIFKEFTFESAHQLSANVEPGHPYSHIHGHSFLAQIHFCGEPDPTTGWVHDFGDIETKLEPVRAKLDHRYLNEIEGLSRPTLETLTKWIWDQLEPSLPMIDRVVVRRGSCGEGCIYRKDA